MEKNENTLTPLMQQYFNIKQNYPNVILFFRLGDFYEMFADDAKEAAPILEVVLTKRQTLPMCGVPYHSVNNYIRKLIKAGKKVAICEQLEDPSSAKTIVKRGVVKVITPGTLLEDNLLESKLNNFLMSLVFEKNNSVAVAVTDISTGDFFTYKTKLSDIENEIIKYKPGEVLICQDNFCDDKLKKVFEKFNITSTVLKNIDFDPAYCEKTIKQILKVSSLNHFGIAKLPGIISAVGSIFVYIRDNQPQSLPLLKNIRYIQTSDFMLLDTVAIKNLELFRLTSSLRQDGSLLSVLDSTVTPMGTRLIKDFLIKPLLDIKQIKLRQDKTKFFVQNEQIRTLFREKLKFVYDIERIVARIVSGTANPKELLALKESVNNVFFILSQLQKYNYFGQTLNFDDVKQIAEKIELQVNPEAPLFVKDGNVIKPSVSQELDQLREISKDAKKYILELELKEKKATGINNLKIGFTNVFGYYIDVTKSNISLVPKHYVRKQTLTNSERYITQELKVLEEKILSANDKIIKLENELFTRLKQEIAADAKQLLEFSKIVGELDVYLAYAHNAVEYNYVCPQVNDGKDLILKDARHPVVEQILQSGNFVTNDIELNDTSKRIMILTGPNMSGKSTYLRQVALIVIMAQMGSFVPCSSATIGIVDKIFTRIGAGDNLVAGESTFMVEMTETANILNQYTDRSLIILDEVGRGTSTYDGMSIAWAIIEFFSDLTSLRNKGAKVLFATHYFELTSLADSQKGIINCTVSVKEWNGTVVFLHKIIDGFTDKSYGVHVAKLAGLPHKVIKRAHQILQGLEKNIHKNFSKFENDIQPDLFTSIEPEILIELKKLDIDNLKPIEALKILSDWKEKYK